MVARNPNAYSLIEIMIVLALVGIMSALAVPNIRGSVQRANEPAQALRVHGFLNEGRNLARRTNRCVKLTRASDGRSLSYTTVSLCTITQTCTCRASALADATGSLDLSAVGPPVTVEALGGNATSDASLSTVTGAEIILFYPDGSTPYSTVSTVPVQLPYREETKVIRVLPAAGIVRIDP